MGTVVLITVSFICVTTYAYDTQHRLTTLTDARGMVFLRNEYSPAGRVVRQVQADGSLFSFDYFSANEVLALGTLAVPCHGLPVRDPRENPLENPSIPVVLTKVLDPRGQTTLHQFTTAGYEIARTDALGQVTRFIREGGTNLLLSTTDPLGRTTSNVYDAQGNVIALTAPPGGEGGGEGVTTRFAYEPQFSRVTQITDALGQATRFQYDASGNLVSTVDPLGQTTAIRYNGFGQPVEVRDPVGQTTQFTYDAVGNLVSTADPLGNTTRRAYDAVGRLTALTAPLGGEGRGEGVTTRFTYDALNRVSRIEDPQGGRTTFTYDPNGNLLTVTDAKNQTTTHTYDVMDRLVIRTDALGRAEAYAYDRSGNLTQFTDRKGQVSAFTYDAVNRRTRAQYADSTSTQFTYDATGRLLGVTDTPSPLGGEGPGEGVIQFGYDMLDRLIQESTPLGTVTYAYDALGRRTTLQVAGQSPVTYSYDAASRLTALTSPLGGEGAIQFAYDAAGRRTALTYPNGVTTSYTYDQASRLLNIRHQGPNNVIEHLRYTYDAAGNRITFNRNFPQADLPQAITAAYDAANQLTTLTNPSPAPGEGGVRALTYDANGNLLNDGTKTYTWDARNRLIGIVSLPSPLGGEGRGEGARFVYDALGRRIAKTINRQTTEYLYDGQDIVAEIERGAVSATYLRGLNIDEPFIRTTREGQEFYHTDALGSPVVLTNAAGAPVTFYAYDPFGRTEPSLNPSTNPFQYTGRENDGPTGLYYYRARYYSPTLQRFISEDPFRMGGGDINLYTYVSNAPINYLDPLGLKIIYLNGSTVSDPETVKKLEALDRALGDKDIKVTSGDRTPAENDRVGGRSRSYHLPGMAADILVDGLTPEDVAEKAAEVGFDGIITYDPAHKGHTHVDTRGYEFNGHNDHPLAKRPTWRTKGEEKGGRKAEGARK